MNELALFAGAGGGILGGSILGWRTVCAVEYDPNARGMLLARQRDGCLPRFPIWDDVRTFDGHPWRGHVDVVSGGFPCQDISAAGKGAGITGERSGLWREMARIVGEVRPRFVWVENSPLLVGRGLALVLGDLAALGYDARWGVVGADDAGAVHRRERVWILAYAMRDRGEAGLPEQEQRQTRDSGEPFNGCSRRPSGQGWWQSEPNVGRVADGLATRLDIHGANAFGGVGRVATGVSRRVARLKAIGNGQVPAAMVLAWRTLMEDIE